MNPLKIFAWVKTVWTWRVLFRDRLRQVQAAGDLVADELEANARRMRTATYTTGLSASYNFRFDAWREHAATLHALWNVNPRLWDDVREAYAELEGSPFDLPSSDRFVDVAARLRVAMRDDI